MQHKVTRKSLSKMTPLGLAKFASEELLMDDEEVWAGLGEPLPKTRLISNILCEIRRHTLFAAER